MKGLPYPAGCACLSVVWRRCVEDLVAFFGGLSPHVIEEKVTLI